MTSARELVMRVTNLPTLPAVYFRVRSVVARRNRSAFDVAREICLDPGLTTRILHAANSALFGIPRKVDNVMDAITVLGEKQIHSLVVATSIASAFAGLSPFLMNMRNFWRMSLYRAIVAHRMAKQAPQGNPERAFIEGLVGDIGHIILYVQLPQIAQTALRRSVESVLPVHLVEREMLGFDYGELGAELMAEWNIPPDIGAAVRHHTEPLHATDAAAEAAALHIATQFACATFNSESSATWVPRIDPRIWEKAGVFTACIDGIKQQADSELEALASAILPGFAQAKIDYTATSQANVA
jgi:HD-like signal output (HDOD) protein